MVIIINSVLVMISGHSAVAAYSAGMRIILFAMVPTLGLSMASISVSASSYGAGLYERVRNVFLFSLKLGFILSLIIGIIIFIFAPQLSSLYHLSAHTKILSRLVAIMLKIYLIFFIATPIGMISGAFFQSLGKGPTSLALTIIREFILSTVCMGFFAFVLDMDVIGVFLGLVIGKLLGAVIAFLHANYYSKNLIKKMDKDKSNNT